MRGDEKANLVEVDGIAHEKDGEENAKELPRGGDGGEDEWGEVAHGVEDEELSDGGTRRQTGSPARDSACSTGRRRRREPAHVAAGPRGKRRPFRTRSASAGDGAARA